MPPPWRLHLTVLAMALPVLLSAQAFLSPAIQQRPPFPDAEMDRIMQRTLTHMDAFDADSSLFWINRGLHHIADQDAPEELYYLLTYRAEVLYYEGLFTPPPQGLPRNEGTLRLEAAISKEYTGACPEALRGNADNRITEVETSPR